MSVRECMCVCECVCVVACVGMFVCLHVVVKVLPRCLHSLRVCSGWLAMDGCIIGVFICWFCRCWGVRQFWFCVKDQVRLTW